MKTILIILFFLLGALALGLWIYSITKWIVRGFRTKDEVAIEKMMDIELAKVLTENKE